MLGNFGGEGKQREDSRYVILERSKKYNDEKRFVSMIFREIPDGKLTRYCPVSIIETPDRKLSDRDETEITQISKTEYLGIISGAKVKPVHEKRIRSGQEIGKATVETIYDLNCREGLRALLRAREKALEKGGEIA